MNARTVENSITTITELMVPAYANFSGKVHGGTLLSIMDKVAYVAAAKHSGAYCVTVAVEGVAFLNPVEVGELVSFKASVNYVGNTTMIVGIRVESLNPKTSVVKHTNSCYFTMAAKDESGSLIQVPELILESQDQIRRFCEGRILRDFSKKKREVLNTDLKDLSYQQLIAKCSEERCVINIKD
jgi:acyl-CoA hydrolase